MSRLFKIKDNIYISIPLLFFFLVSTYLSRFYLDDIRVWLVIIIGTTVLLVLFLNPFYFYLIFICMIALEGIPLLEKISFAKIFGVIITAFLFFKFLVTREKIDLGDRFYLYFVLFMMAGLASTFISVEYFSSLSLLLTYLSLGLLFFVTRYFLISSTNIDKTLTCLILSTLITYIIIHLTGQSESLYSYSSSTWRISGGAGDPNSLASVVLVALPLTLYRAIYSHGILRLLFYVAFASFVILLIYTGSRGGMLGFLGMTGVLVYHYGSRRIKQISFFALISAGILYFLTPDEFWFRASTIFNPEAEKGSSISGRLILYQAALRMFLDHPFIGVGIANFVSNSFNYGAPLGLVTHNTYLEILSGGGLLTFIPFALIFLDCARKLKLNKNYDAKSRDLIICLRASFISILITAFFYTADHEKILWFLFALISSVYYLTTNKDRDYGHT